MARYGTTLKRKTRDKSCNTSKLLSRLEFSFVSRDTRPRTNLRFYEFSDLTTVNFDAISPHENLAYFSVLFSSRDHRVVEGSSSRYRLCLASKFFRSHAVYHARDPRPRESNAIHLCSILSISHHQCIHPKLQQRLEFAPMIDGVSKDINVSTAVTYIRIFFRCLSVPFITVK